MFLKSHSLQVFITILQQNLSSSSWVTSLWFSFSSLFTHWPLFKPSLSHILINASINVLSVYFYTFKFFPQDNFHGCLHCPFYPLFAFPYWLLLRHVVQWDPDPSKRFLRPTEIKRKNPTNQRQSELRYGQNENFYNKNRLCKANRNNYRFNCGRFGRNRIDRGYCWVTTQSNVQHPAALVGAADRPPKHL